MCVSLCASSAIVVSLAIPLPWRDDVQSLHISLNVMRSWLNLSPCSCSLRIWSRTFRASALVPFTMRTTRFCLPVMGSRPKQRATLHLPFMTSPFLLRAGVMLPSPFAMLVHLLLGTSRLQLPIYPNSHHSGGVGLTLSIRVSPGWTFLHCLHASEQYLRLLPRSLLVMNPML